MMEKSQRVMARVVQIDEVRGIPGADAIDAYRVGGWWVVDKKAAYAPGDLAIFAELDSWIPHELAPFLSRGQEPREYNGVRGERLRSVKLRGQISQGLLLPLKHLTNYGADLVVGSDVTDALGIQKYEAPIPAQLAGEVRGAFPSYIPRTDQERVQNLSMEIAQWCAEGKTFEISEKLEGSSMTVYSTTNDEGVCSRNLDLKESVSNTLWKVVKRDQLLDKIAGLNIALQGELVGEGIQGNIYQLRGQHFYVFDIYDIAAGRYYTPSERRLFCKTTQIQHVPVLTGCADKDLGTGSIQDILDWAEGKSALNTATEREGIVFKCNQDPDVSFKAISNKYLISNAC
jgi:RNA ligase (TIGR02306 family)